MKAPLSPTEQPGPWDQLESMTAVEIAAAMSACDREAAKAVEALSAEIGTAIGRASGLVAKGGRVFYLGAGTSGRLGVLDASEIPPTFGVEGVFIGLIAGGDGAIRKAVEGAEDDAEGGVRDLERHGANAGDVVVGIAASGRTPYVVGAMKWASNTASRPSASLRTPMALWPVRYPFHLSPGQVQNLSPEAPASKLVQRKNSS